MNSGEKNAIAAGADALDAAVDTLARLDLIPVSDNDIVELMQRIETADRKLAVVKRDLIVQVCTRSLPKKACAGSPALYLQEVLRIGHGDAINRFRSAEQPWS